MKQIVFFVFIATSNFVFGQVLNWCNHLNIYANFKENTSSSRYEICEGDPILFVDTMDYPPPCSINPNSFRLSFHYYDSVDPFNYGKIFHDTLFTVKYEVVYDFPIGVGDVVCDYVDSIGNAKSAWAIVNGCITVRGCPPEPFFSQTESNICENQCISYADSSVRKPKSWYWNFEGGEPAEWHDKTPPPICYSKAGRYTTTLTTSNSYGENITQKKIVVAECNKCMYIPNAFTPNGDGKNDVFECFSSCQISYFNLAIFDRNGERVFQSDNISKYWNGEYKNESLSNSIYIYNLIVSYSDGKTERYKGSIILIK